MPSPKVVLGTYPVSTGTGQGYFGDGQLTTLYENDTNQSVSTPYFHRYLADLQQELSPNSVFTLSYIGALGRNGWYYKDLNVPSYQTGWADQNTFNAARPNNSGRFSDIYAQRAGLNSSYNAGIVKFERRMSHGVQILSHYTFSKTMSDRGLNGQFTSLGFDYPQSIIHYRGEATLSHRHRFLFQGNYEPDYAKHLPAYLRPALGDWHLSAIGTYESGDALTVTDQNNPAQDYAASFGLPNVLHNPNLGRSQRTYSQYFDVNAFVEPAGGVRGTAQPGSVRGPGQENWDISFGKNITFYERLHAEIRADMFNAFNHTQWNSIDTTLNDTVSGYQFGQVNGGREGRIISLAGKIVF